MLIRAIFWIGLVSILMPRAPDGAALMRGALTSTENTFAPSTLGASSLVVPRRAASGLVAGFENATLQNLLKIKADIEVEQRARAARGG
jgi:hypothetical protein